MRMSRLAALVVTGFLVGAMVVGPAGASPSKASARVQTEVEPQLLFTALQLADHVRYAVTLVRPLSTTITNVRVDVSLPAGAELTETLQTPNRSVFLGIDGNALSWGAPSYEAGDPVDAFAFRLTRPLSAEAQVRVSWEIDGQPRMDEIRAAPEVQVATTVAGEVTLRRDVESAPIGETGVRVEAGLEPGLDGVTLRVRKLGPEANPPTGVGSPWWCAMLTVEGLPDGASVFVVVPLRQPLPPGARVDLFADRGGSWERLEDQGYATADGQFVGFRHAGGSVAAGVTSRFQPVGFPTGGVLALPAPLPPLPPALVASITGPSLIPFSTSSVHSIKVNNVGAGAARQVRVWIWALTSLKLTLTSIFGISGGFTCRMPVQFDPTTAGAECTSPSLAAGSSGTILLGSTSPPYQGETAYGGSLLAIPVVLGFPASTSDVGALFPIRVGAAPR